MLPNKEFTPQVSVVDNDNKTVKPDKETWYYNEAASPLPMKWDGKEATVKYDYICPGGSQDPHRVHHHPESRQLHCHADPAGENGPG